MLFNPIKERHMLRKEINRLLSKGITNIYLKNTIEKKKPTQNFVFKSLKRLSPVSFCGVPTHADITELSDFLLQLQNQRSGSKTLHALSIIFIWKGNDVLSLFRMGFFGAAHGLARGKAYPPQNLSHISYNNETWHSYTSTKNV